MNPREPRRIWLVTKDGTPVECAWALFKTHAEAEAAGEAPGWAAALGPHRLEADGWNATPTQWRRVPMFVRPGFVENAQARVEGRDVVVGGLRYSLDTAGRKHPKHTAADPHEPLEPDAEVEDEAAVVETLERCEVALRDKVAQHLATEDVPASERVRLQAIVDEGQAIRVQFCDKAGKRYAATNRDAEAAGGEILLRKRAGRIERAESGKAARAARRRGR